MYMLSEESNSLLKILVGLRPLGNTRPEVEFSLGSGTLAGNIFWTPR
jgi:hypothetical protein